MDFSDLDRDVLLQEIKQIQQTIEASGGNFESYSSEDDEDDSDEESDLEEWKQNETNVWEVFGNGEDEVDNKENLQNWFYHIPDDNQDLVSPPSRSSTSSAGKGVGQNRVSAENIINEASRILAHDSNIRRTTPENIPTPASPVSGFSSRLSSCIPSPILSRTVTPTEVNKDLGGKEKVRFELSNRKRKKIKGGRIAQIKNEDGVSSVDVSIPPSLKSLPEKEKEQINMSNLYVERIFRNYRDKKPVSSRAVSMPGLKYDSRNFSCSANLATLENLLQVNKRYQEMLHLELKKIQLALQRNRLAQDDFDTTKSDNATTYASLSRACIGKFAKPYFKDEEGYGPPDNEDTKEKRSVQKVNPSTKSSRPWKASEVAALKEGVYNNNLELRLKPLLYKLKEVNKVIKEKEKLKDKNINRIEQQRLTREIKEIKEMPRTELMTDATEIDFFKISKNYVLEREEFDCRLQWVNVAHPLINQEKFTKEEDSIILRLAKKYNNYQWEAVARELATNRSPVQCLQRYQRTLNKDMVKTTWDSEDDAALKKAVKLYGSDWIAIADYLGDRTSNQCLNRWEKSLNPSIKRGKWSQKEDELRLKGMVSEIGNVLKWMFLVEQIRSAEKVSVLTDGSVNCDNQKVAKERKRHKAAWKIEELSNQEPILVAHREFFHYYFIVCNLAGNCMFKVNNRNTRTRYVSSLDQSKDSSPFTEEEDNKLIELTKKIGTGKWARVAKEFPGRHDDQIWRRYRQIQAESYHKYRRDVMWKRNSVMTYFLHRDNEKRDYELEDLKVNIKPYVSTAEARKVEVVREKLRKEGFSDEEITKKIARLHYEGYFSVKKTIQITKKKKSTNNSGSDIITEAETTLNTPAIKFEPQDEAEDSSSKTENKSKKGRNFDAQFVSKITETIAEADNPETELPEIDRNEIKQLGQKKKEDGSRSVIQRHWTSTLKRQCERIVREFQSGIKTFPTTKKYLEELCHSTVDDLTEKEKGEKILRKHISKYIKQVEKEAGVFEERDSSIDSDQQIRISKEQRKRKKRTIKTEEASAEHAKRRRKRKSTAPLKIVKSVYEMKVEDDSDRELLPSREASGLDERLQTFTLLLQALHVDTAGVIRSLPQEDLVNDVVSTTEDINPGDLPFPDCFPISPNIASLQGFRTMLLHRRTLSSIVNSRDSLTGTRDLSYRKTKNYDKLTKRFRSTFIWPAFLATFMPKYITDGST